MSLIILPYRLTDCLEENNCIIYNDFIFIQLVWIQASDRVFTV